MKLIVHLIDGNVMSFEGRVGSIKTKVEDGFYTVATFDYLTKTKEVRINVQFILYIEEI